ncbi:hypothetical protein [Clostridium sp. ZS2-4]|nr:hypothetical protein [Clostridium sp. ZS2-4]MCY6355190.1 hypothetical protein [Clostridium sp. ZS2-4]
MRDISSKESILSSDVKNLDNRIKLSKLLTILLLLLIIFVGYKDFASIL